MVRNRTLWSLARWSEGVDTAELTLRLKVNVHIRSEEIRIGGNIICRFPLFEHPARMRLDRHMEIVAGYYQQVDVKQHMKLWARFVETVAHHFRFLETEFGFRQRATKAPFVIYESDKLEVMVYFDDDGCGELDLRIRRLADDPAKVPSIGVTTIMLLVDRDATKGYLSPFLRSEESVETEVQRLAALLTQYGSKILRGDQQEFEKIEQLRGEAERELASPWQPES